MRVQIRDGEALARLSLVNVRAYLASHGWQATGQYGTVATIYVKTDANRREHEILLPAYRELGDYAARMGDIVETLSDVEGRSQLAVYADLADASEDNDAISSGVHCRR